MIRVLVQEERPKREVNDDGVEIVGQEREFVTTNEFTSEDRVIVAAMLRGMANRFDPPKEY